MRMPVFRCAMITSPMLDATIAIVVANAAPFRPNRGMKTTLSTTLPTAAQQREGHTEPSALVVQRRDISQPRLEPSHVNGSLNYTADGGDGE